MKKIQVSKYIKLGTALRYLIDAKDAEEAKPLGEPCILPNINHVITLVEELGFDSTIEEPIYQQLKDLKTILQNASLNSHKITKDHANELATICREIRVLLLNEGKRKFVFELESEEEFPMISPPPNNDNDDWKKSITDYANQNPILAFIIILSILALSGFVVYLVGKGLISLPGRLEPQNPESEITGNIESSPSKVRVNLFCTWKSRENLTKPIESAAVTATSVKTGKDIHVLGNGIDSNARISFEMKQNDIVSVTIRHPDILDSQKIIPNIEIDESKSELEEQNYTVSRRNCFFDRK